MTEIYLHIPSDLAIRTGDSKQHREEVFLEATASDDHTTLLNLVTRIPKSSLVRSIMPTRIPLEEIPATIRAVPDSRESESNGDRPSSGRAIVVCLDGTGDQFDDDVSNVIKVFQALRKDDPRQLTYYQSGVGTYTSASKGSLKSGLSAAVDMAVGGSIGVHVREAYSFLMQNCELVGLCGSMLFD